MYPEDESISPTRHTFHIKARGVLQGEMETRMMVYERLRGRVPVPEVYGWEEDENQGFIYMELIPGDTLMERWGSMG